MKRLIINADDFGMASSINEAVIRCFDADRLSSTTLMVNAPAADEALAYSKREPLRAVGLHLNLVHFKPIGVCPALTGGQGFHGFGALVRLQLTDSRTLYTQARAELEAQLEKFVEQAGHAPSHIDSHVWGQVLPAVFDAIVDVAKARGIPAVRNIEGDSPMRSMLATLQIGGVGPGNVWRSCYQAVKAIWFKAQSRWCRYPERLRAAGLFTPDRYYGVVEGLLYRNLETRLTVIDRCLSSLPDGEVGEFMVHPGGDARPEGVRYSSEDAAIETAMLLSDRLMAVFDRQGVRLLPGYVAG